ncbi:MAG: alpha-ketoglutarate-dependent dioxygenase AlkB [Nocardioidaceae bacterium]|nr:alpha-ketoglutarate-dependent dioxygenase AlkB [Nocardioidaceae bacterium]
MTTHFQASLLEEAAVAVAGLGPLARSLRRTELTRGAWVDVLPGWVSGSDELFLRLVDTVPWRGERRQMYAREVDVPRLLSWYGEGAVLPDAVLEQAKQALSEHYRDDLGEPFCTVGLCYYRDGRDSVAWHGDTIGRGKHEDTMVAILSLGAARRLMLRPRGGGESMGFALGHGDLIVMGGSCQRTWEHAILKTTRPVGPRISVQFRPRGVR